MTDRLTRYLIEHGLDTPQFEGVLANYYRPLADKVYQASQTKCPLVLGINGGQGSGKSTLATVLKLLLEASYPVEVAVLSIDDFYLPKAKRAAMAANVHPLFATRGVPGTHDVGLGLAVMKAMLKGEPVFAPVFDKSSDERLSRSQWRAIPAKVQVILFEGWCVGAKPMIEDSLAAYENDLERIYDPECVWRSYYNHCLATDYQKWFGLIDVMIMLKVPSIGAVINWRTAQQRHTHEQVNVMDFVQYFERLTLSMLSDMPTEMVLSLNEHHDVIKATGTFWEQIET